MTEWRAERCARSPRGRPRAPTPGRPSSDRRRTSAERRDGTGPAAAICRAHRADKHAPPDLERVLERLQPGCNASAIHRARNRRASRRSRGSGSRTRYLRPAAPAGAAANRHAARPRAALPRSSDAAESSGSGLQCHPARAPRWQPDTAEAERHDGCAGRECHLHGCTAHARGHTDPPNPPPTITTRCTGNNT